MMVSERAKCFDFVSRSASFKSALSANNLIDFRSSLNIVSTMKCGSSCFSALPFGILIGLCNFTVIHCYCPFCSTLAKDYRSLIDFAGYVISADPRTASYAPVAVTADYLRGAVNTDAQLRCKLCANTKANDTGCRSFTGSTQNCTTIFRTVTWPDTFQPSGALICCNRTVSGITDITVKFAYFEHTASSRAERISNLYADAPRFRNQPDILA